jgi:hypothetical protein
MTVIMCRVMKTVTTSVGVVDVGERLVVLLLHDQQPAGVLQPSLAGDLPRLLATRSVLLALQHPDTDPFLVGLHGVGGLVHDPRVRTRVGLIDPFGVEQVNLAGAADMHVFHQRAKRLGVDGGPQDPFLVAVDMRDGDDEMRLPAEAHEHVADVDPLLHDLGKPELPGVVARPEIVGADVCEMIAVLADDAEVRQRPDVLVEQVEDRLQGALLQEFVTVVGPGDQSKFRGVLAQEPFDDLAVVLHLGLKEVEHALAGEPTVMPHPTSSSGSREHRIVSHTNRQNSRE